jgi:hypothetical protein
LGRPIAEIFHSDYAIYFVYTDRRSIEGTDAAFMGESKKSGSRYRCLRREFMERLSSDHSCTDDGCGILFSMFFSSGGEYLYGNYESDPSFINAIHEHLYQALATDKLCDKTLSVTERDE